MKRFLVILTLCMFSFVGMGDALYWMVDENANVIGESGQVVGDLNTFLVPVPWTDEDHSYVEEET